MTRCDVAECPEHYRCDLTEIATCCVLYRMMHRKDPITSESEAKRRDNVQKRTCVECGRTFWVEIGVTTGNPSTVCSKECRDIRTKKRQRKWYEKTRGEVKAT